MNFQPGYPKHTSMKELEEKIEEGIDQNYTHIFCVIDMDTKDKASERSLYISLKKKYTKPINKPKKGIHCDVRFFETHPCTELFFLYYFRYTTRPYNGQEALLDDLKKQCGYQKKVEFFKKSKGLHAFFEKKGGKFDDAIRNSKQSINKRTSSPRDYTYSELGRMMEELEALRQRTP